MDLESMYGEELEMVRETARAFLRRRVEPRLSELENGTDERFWHDAAEAGLLGVAIPEDEGGAGADPLALCVISEELGRSPAGASLTAAR